MRAYSSTVKSLLDYVRGVRHPEAFHGRGISHDFFEGWYIKLVSADASQRWAVIPGIFHGTKGGDQPAESVAFVQVLDGQTGRSWFHEFPVDSFKASTIKFDVSVGQNHFDETGVTLDLPNIKGRLEFTSELDGWPVTLLSPGIMGWYGLVPFMECFHGIVSFGHGLAGNLEIDNQKVSFAGGRAYIEKDWGSSFPSGYFWLQSNHFAEDPTASIVASAAIIPWLGSAFRGFIVGLKHGGHLYEWTTYGKSKELDLDITDNHVSWKLTGKDGGLEIIAERKTGGLLHAPLKTAMFKRVEETMLTEVSVKHLDKNGNVVFESIGDAASMEVFGDLEKLLKL